MMIEFSRRVDNKFNIWAMGEEGWLIVDVADDHAAALKSVRKHREKRRS